MKMKTRNWMRGLAVALVVATAGCGGGGSQDTTAPAASQPTATVVTGAITGFGSVIVAGRHFDTQGAAVRLDDRSGTDSELRVGQVVRLEGSFDDSRGRGTATLVEAHHVVDGPVQSLDVAAGTLVVLGQSVRVDALTFFDDDISPASPAGLTIGMLVEVHGFRDANQVVLATRIEREDAGEFEVRGIVEQVDTVARRFRISALVVDYSTAQLDDLPGGAPANGQLVEVEGAALDANGVLRATAVAGKNLRVGDDNRHFEIEGLVTRFVSATDFDVNGQPVTTSSTTRFERGTAANLALNARVEVEGRIVNGVLQASKVQFENEANLRLAAPVQDIEAAAGRFTALGVVVETGMGTRFEDRTAAQLREFDVTSLRVGDFVEVRGTPGSQANRIDASRVERDDAEDELDLRGPAENVAAPGLVILGVNVLVNGATEFEDEADMPIDAATFFARAPGQIVQVHGQLQGSILVAREIELED
jgi:hypothetical protein